MIYLKIKDEWHTSDARNSNDLTMATYKNCQIIYNSVTDDIEATAEFNTKTGNWDNTDLDITLAQIKLEIFLKNENFTKWLDYDEYE